MQQVTAQQPASGYAQDFQARRKDRMVEPVWLIERRQAAMDAFAAKGFPTRKDEAWRNLDLTPVRGNHFEALHIAGSADQQVEAIKSVVPGAIRIVYVDGQFSEGSSDLQGLPAGVTVQPLLPALERHDALLEAHLARLSGEREHPFASLNTALFFDGVLIHAGRGAVLERPIVVAHVASAEATGRAVYPRTLIVAEEGAELRVAEFHLGGEGAYLSCPVTEIDVAANASVHHHKIQQEGADAYHFGVIAARLGRDARLRGHSHAFGAKSARTDLYVDLTEPGGEAALDGLYITAEGQYSDHHTYVRHLAEHCNSHQRFKGVLTAKSEAVFDGLVLVAKGAQKTDARQENRNLLLSKRALAHSNPRLEIHADDVKCSHGSSVGELDKDALIYLRSRGIGPQDAQGLLTYAFIGEVLEPITIEPLRQYVRAAALARLPGDATVKEMA